MAYIEEICVAGKTVEVSKYYSVRCPGAKGEKREPRKDVTTEAQKRVNQRRAETKLRRLMNTNFNDGDYLIRFDFSKNIPKDSEEMQKITSAFIKNLRRKLKKLGKEFKYIYVKEVGKRGGRHIHMVMNKCDTDLIRQTWTHGGIHIDPLFTNGQYADVASYFIKYADRTEQTEGGELIGKRWYASRNLKKPKIIKKIISARNFRKEARPRKGYMVEPGSVRSGFSEVTGFEYFTYRLIKTDKEGGGG